MLPSPARARRACPLPGQGEGSGKAAKGKTLPADSFTRCAFDFTLVYSHQYFFGLAIPGGESTVYSTTSTPSAVSFPDQVSVSVSSSLTRPRSCRYSSSRRTCICERPIFTSCSTRQTMVSLTPIGRPASSTRSIRQRASSRCFCSRSAPLGILILSVARCPSVILERNEGHPPFRGENPATLCEGDKSGYAFAWCHLAILSFNSPSSLRISARIASSLASSVFEKRIQSSRRT